MATRPHPNRTIPPGQRIAIVGTGIAGLTCTHLLHKEHHVTLFEQSTYAGGHTNTVDVATPEGPVAIDTGFIVFNDRTYSNFNRLLAALNVPSQPTWMSFSVRDERNGLEYSGHGLSTLFAQRSRLFEPAHWRFVSDIVRFSSAARAFLASPTNELLGDFLARGRFGSRFTEDYIIPMGSAIWSASTSQTLAMPFRFFATFFDNHGMLDLGDRPVWRTIRGGSREYITPLLAPLLAQGSDRVRLSTPVISIRREPASSHIATRAGEESFDHVILASHADQTLAMLADATPLERELLSAFPYQPNRAVLHTDARLMPRKHACWSAWNYHVLAQPGNSAAVTYNMNILQSLTARETYLVTLNRDDIDPAKIIRTIDYHHPVFTPQGIAAQPRHREISGTLNGRTHFCGAYWRHGFHEDGVVSALNACAPFGVTL